MLDVVVRGGTVVDGTGKPGVRADVGVSDGRVVSVGDIDDTGATTVEADGLLVAPGFVDPHTHYDAQLLWDPSATPSNLHGVTTVIGGNCGFTLAPLDPGDADYLRRMMARVEGMPLAALEKGTDWDWRGFGDYLSRFDGGLGVNAGFLVGHCALRRRVMGADAVGETATAEQIESMRALLDESLAAGGLGLSTSRAFTHSDGDGEPVPSRHAAPDEVLALCEEVARHPGTTLEAITDGCLNGFSDEEVDLFTRMSLAAQRPLNWNVLTIDAGDPSRTEHQLQASSRAAAAGGRLVALTMPILVGMNMSFATYCALFLIPGWRDVLDLPIPERMAKLRDPDVRRHLDEQAHSDDAGVLRRLAGWGRYTIGDTFSAANDGLQGRTVADIASERGSDPFDTLLDLVLADDLRTVLWPSPTDDDPASWELRARVWQDERVLIGGSDAGAHLDRMCGAPYPTAFLADCLRGRKLLPVEQAIRLMTSAPADLFGLRERGRIAAGSHADLVLIDPEKVDAGPIELIRDLPGDSARLVAAAEGIPHVFVNGVATITDGAVTGALPGGIMRSGRDTDTVAVVPIR
jgi:N-acyl-D-aspartate/D-glutamate deacylase